MQGPEEDLSTLLSRRDHLNILRYIRAHKIREPNLVVTHGKLLLGLTDNGTSSSSSSSKSLGEAERLAALEQVCVAALDVGHISLAESCLDAMQAGASTSSVPKESARYRKLLGMCLEASGDFDGASAVYDALLKDNPSNRYAAKRKYCILAAQSGKEKEAMQALNDYLETNSGDIPAWNQMAEVCLSVSDFKGAAYCYEEVALGCPLDSTVHTKLGETYCTAGGIENAKLARKHLAQAVQLDSNNLRAWYGLIAAAESYLEEVERAGKGKKELEEEGVEVAKELILFGGEKLMSFYKGTKMGKLVERMLKESAESL
jgi:tetratricopeptide (TPR) repeat protein